MDVSANELQQLMEIGFVAAGNGRFQVAETIFTGVAAARPESELPLIGRAFTKICAGQAGNGISLLQEALDVNPDSDLAMSFLGAALDQVGLKQASRNALEQVVEANGDPAAVALAKAILEN